MKTVYLAGGIDGLSKYRATAWRQYATRLLRDKGFDVIDPTEHLTTKKRMSHPWEVVSTAFQNIDSADILLVEMDNARHAYIGTAIEIYYAWRQGKPVICWGTANRGSYFLRYHATELWDTLGEAIDRLLATKGEGELYEKGQ